MRADSKELAKVWLRFIDDDLKAVALVIADLPAAAAFDVQQAVEKSIKAALVMDGLEAPRTHDLKRLYALASHGLDWCADEGWLDQVSSWVATSRYPSDIYGAAPLVSEIGAALIEAEKLAAEIRSKLA